MYRFYLRGMSICPACKGEGYRPTVSTTWRERCDWCEGTGSFVGGRPNFPQSQTPHGDS